MLFAAISPLGLRAAVDVSKLPAPAARSIEFARDIKPIFASSCWRCHGTERPKGHFSLATRAGALKGGDEGIDIVPGDSARSPLVHYVARLVPDMEMPPTGKADPLTPEQISLLRAWIDQGVVWEQADAAENALQFSFAPAVRWTTVSGNAEKFQQQQWIRRGFSEGVSEFRLAQKLTNGATFTAEGRAFTDDYKVTLDLRQNDVGFVRSGFEQFRHYYNDRGPRHPFAASGFSTASPGSFALHRDLRLDVGKAFIEFGLTRPRLPQITVGYEYGYKDGTKSTEEWGPVFQQIGGTNLARHIFPAWKDVSEDVHILTLDVSHDVAGVRLEDNARAEFWNLKTSRRNDIAFAAGQTYPSALALTRESHDQWQFANALRGEKAVNEWLFLSGGYLFTRFEADAGLQQSTSDGAGRAAPGVYWAANNIVLKQSSHVFNLNGQGGPWRGFTAAVGVQPEFSEQRGFGDINNREGDPTDPTIGLTGAPGFVQSDLDRATVDETVLLRYTALPMTVVFAEARLKQERIGQFEEEIAGEHDFLRDTDAANYWQEYEAGLSVSPWRQIAFNASYKFRLHESDFDHDRDEQPRGTVGDGYSAFIRSRSSQANIVNARLVLRPAAWLKASLNYQVAATDYRTMTDPVTTPPFRIPARKVFAGNHDSSAYSVNLTVTPVPRFYVTTTLSFQPSRITTEDNHTPAVAAYDGEIWSVLSSIHYALAMNTDLQASYSYSRARYAQHNVAGGLPLGIDYDLHGVQAGIRRQFNTNITASVQYGFFKYHEPASGGWNDYTAHMLFGMIAVRLP